MVVTEEGKYLFFHKVVPENTQTSLCSKQWTVRKQFFKCIAKYLKENQHIVSILLENMACKFVLGHYLFLEAHSFPPVLLLENCLHLGTDYVCGQISLQIFASNKGYCLFIIIMSMDIPWISLPFMELLLLIIFRREPFDSCSVKGCVWLKHWRMEFIKHCRKSAQNHKLPWQSFSENVKKYERFQLFRISDTGWDQLGHIISKKIYLLYFLGYADQLTHQNCLFL